MKRYAHFTQEQARDLWLARHHDVQRIVVVVVLLVVALAVGFGAGLWKIQDAYRQADAASRAAQQIIRERAVEAKLQAVESEKRIHDNAVTGYAACRRQAETAIALRLEAHILTATTDPAIHTKALAYHRFLKAQHLLDIPQCPKPPKGE